MQTSKFFIFRDLFNFTAKYIGGHFYTQVEKYEKVESVNIHNDYKTRSKNWGDKKKTNEFCVICKSV